MNIRKEKRSKINHLKFHLRKLEIEDQIKPKVSTKIEIIRMSIEINEIETGK